MLSKVSNANLDVQPNHGGDKDVVDGLNNNSLEFSISLEFHHYVNNVIVLVKPKDVMVYARGTTTSKTTL